MTWFDHLIKYFIIHSMKCTEAKYTLHGDLSGRFRLQHDLKCKHYDWFLEHVYPESEMVVDSYHIGQV